MERTISKTLEDIRNAILEVDSFFETRPKRYEVIPVRPMSAACGRAQHHNYWRSYEQTLEDCSRNRNYLSAKNR